MANGGKKLLIGCGLGCGGLILVGALLVGSGVLWVRDLAEGFENAVELRAQLDERHGAPEAWTPPADGRVPAARLEAFLAMRERTAGEREQIAATMRQFGMSEQRLQTLQDASWREQTREVWRITTSGFDLAPGLGTYFRARNRALLEVGIGHGEYTYLYTVGYWRLLSIDPADGPEQVVPARRADGDVVTIDVDAERSSIGVQPQVMRRVRDELLAMLDNQLAACDARAACEAGWRDALATELAAMRDDPQRLPWPDGLPEPLAASLEPYRDRLRASYERATNPFELARNRKRGSWSIQSE